MKFRWDKRYLYWGITGFLVIVSSICFFLILNRFDVVAVGLQFVGKLLMPFIIGFVLAYLLSPVMEFFENFCFLPLARRRNPETKSRAPRAFAVVVTILLALALVFGLFSMLVPQLVESIRNLITQLPGYFKAMQSWLVELTDNNQAMADFVNGMFDNASKAISTWAQGLLPQIQSILSGLTTGVMGVVGNILDIFVGLVVAIYVMFSKESFAAQTKKLLYAFFPIHASNAMLRVTRRADRVFGSFIKGKLIDSALIACICFIGMSALNLIFGLGLPYTLLISVIIGVSNIIPFFGPIIGAVPSALLILVSDIAHPMKCIYFVLFIIVLQQFDGNILGPRILGESTGLSAFWVLFSIMVFGGLFGFVGMIIGVPAFSLIYSFIAEIAAMRLQSRALPVKTTDYNGLDYMDSGEPGDSGGNPVYLPPPVRREREKKFSFPWKKSEKPKK